MKKTFRFLSMAVLLVVGAIMTGCSSDDNIDNPQQPANKDNVVTLTATVGFEANATTRAVTEAGVKTFESTNKIAVFYEDGDGKIQKAESGALTLSNSDKTAIFTVTLSNPKSGGNVRYVYPATMAKALDATPPAYPAAAAINDATIDYTGLYGSQNGTLATLGTNFDLAVYDGALSGTDLPASATLTNPLAICKFTLTDGSSPITSSVNSLTVSDGTNAYAVAPYSLSAIYVAMKPVATKKIAFTASTGSKTYFKTTASNQTLVASTIYTSITVSMQELTLGNVFCSDGSVYADASAATNAGKTPVAKIAYLGNDAETSPTNTAFKNGLALALRDVSSTKSWCYQTSATCLGTQYDDDTKFNDLAGIANTDALVGHTTHTHDAANEARNYNSGTHPTGTSVWFLPSAGQWNKMIGATGRENLGLQESYRYWSSTEYYDDVNHYHDYAWIFDPKYGNWNSGDKDDDRRVRACLAF